MAERTIAVALRDTGAGGPAVTIGGIGAWDLLRARAARADCRLVPLEQLEPSDGSPAALLWDFGSYAVSPRVPGLDRAHVVAWSLESPLIAHRAYHRLGRIGNEAVHVFGFGGVGPLLRGTSAQFHEVNWPNDERPVHSGPPWRDRRLLSIVNSNKRAHHWSDATRASSPVVAARILAAAALAHTYRLRGTWTLPELYVERLRAIEHFADVDGFDLYGAAWDREIPGATAAQSAAVRRAYRGTVASKGDALSPYRFSLVIENTSFDGYISEKLYDCWFAGTIPVYLGAPDVSARLPQGSYVDVRDYTGMDELEAALRTMPPTEAKERRAIAAAFVQSHQFAPFTASYFADQLWHALAPAGAR